MISRRDALKLGAAGLGYVTLGPGGAIGRVSTAFADNPVSPKTTPFVQELPIPPAPLEVPPFHTPLLDDPATSRFIGAGTKFYEIVAEDRFVKLHPDLPATSLWAYRDVNVPNWPFALGPTFEATYGQGRGFGRVVRLDNLLPVSDPLGIGHSTLSMHLHGGHHPAASDGFPTDLDGFPRFTIPPAGSRDYLYPQLDQNFDTPTPSRDERPALLWYHDHILDFTAVNVYRGLVGVTFTHDDLDTGDELTGLRLPSNRRGGEPVGPFDIPLVLQDRLLDRDGQLVYDSMSHNGFLGDTFLVNMAIQPVLHVAARKYRFRFLNGSNARLYQMFLTNAAGTSFPFDQIATEGGLLSRPLRGITSFLLAMAERFEIVVDFSAFPEGTELFFENRLQQTDGRKPDGLVRHGTRLMKIVVGPREDDPSVVPDVLRPFAPISPAQIDAAVRRTFVFERRHGMWAINGELAGNLEAPLATPRDDAPEIWHFVNKSGGWVHPVHTHSEFGRVLLRNGKTPPLGQRDGIAKKDTVLLGENEDAHVFFNFRDFDGAFVFHCHNIEHEDMAMMGRFDVLPK